ncbi:MAG: M56 family metallopeptidase [Clostridiales Family XIII bacterium]|jgi:beta-lactamase regulating signal transducer with metallopeptidase domain|nr:M56 family metallopeptidase [Clostridiales Family XIII bacterium]
MSDLLKTVVVMTITGSVLALVLFALNPFIKNRLPKAAQYYLWLVVLAALLVPFSRFVMLPAQYPALSNAVSYYLPTQEDLFNRVKPYETELPNGYIGVPEADMPTVEALIPAPWVQGLLDWCRLIYPLGAILVFGYFVTTYLAFCGRLKRRNVLTDIKSAIPVYRNPLASTPMLIGFFQPSIILPDREYTDEQLNAVLAHELTHHRRKDVLVRWLTVAACVVHWFNPLVWLARREIDRACELSCDEAVIRNLDVNGKQNYGDTLLYIAADAKTTRSALAMCEEKRDLKERLGAIMKSKKRGVLAVCVSAVLIVGLAAGAVALGAGSGKDLVQMEIVEVRLNAIGKSYDIKWEDRIYSEFNDLGNAYGLRGSEIGYAFDGDGVKWKVFECEGYSADEYLVVYPDMIMSNYGIYKRGTGTAPQMTSTSAFPEQGITFEFPFEYGLELLVSFVELDNVFQISAPNLGIGVIARVAVYPVGSAYMGTDEPFVFLGSNNHYDFYWAPSTDLPLPGTDDPNFEDAAVAFEAIREAFDKAMYKVSLYDI